jgi:RNA polymerase sigma factor (sigma-70 family)
MDDKEWLAQRFDENRAHLRAVAYRMLGSVAEADDAVQDTWLRLSRAETSDVENLRGWLTTVIARVCLNMLRSRNTRREESLDVHLPTRSSELTARPNPMRKRCWPTLSASPCSSCSIPSHRPSGSRSCCMTCSSCRSTRSVPWSVDHLRQRDNSPVRRGGASKAPHPGFRC